KKGRPAHTLSALVPRARAEAVRRLFFLHTPTLGVRETAVTKHPLERSFDTVEVDGEVIAVKIGRLADGTVVNTQPEWADVAGAAAALGRPARRVLAEAAAAAAAAGIGRGAPDPDPRRDRHPL